MNFRDAGGGAHHLWKVYSPDAAVFTDSLERAREIAVEHAQACGVELGAWVFEGILSQDQMTYEHAYGYLAPYASLFVAELLDALATSVDGFTRGQFVELLGDAGDPRAIPALVAELEHRDQNVRQWAVTALERIGGSGVDAELARYRRRHPEEFE